jgi:hypothetical protein
MGLFRRKPKVEAEPERCASCNTGEASTTASTTVFTAREIRRLVLRRTGRSEAVA